MIDTPLKGAAIGLSIVALAVLLLSLSDRMMRLADRRTDRAGRDARRERFRGYAVMLLAFAIGMVVVSRIVEEVT